MAICAKIAAGITINCNDDSINAGVEAEEIHLFNYTDVDQESSTFDSTNPLKMKSISMLSAATGFTFQGLSNSVRPTYTNTIDGYLPNKNTHTLEFRVFNYTDTNKDILNDMIGSKIIAVYFAKSKVIDVMGWSNGMQCTVSKDFYENDGSFTITLATGEGEFERNIPYSYVGATSPQASFETLKAEILAL